MANGSDEGNGGNGAAKSEAAPFELVKPVGSQVKISINPYYIAFIQHQVDVDGKLKTVIHFSGATPLTIDDESSEHFVNFTKAFENYSNKVKVLT